MAHDTCNIKGCDGKVKARGWCPKHWERWRKYGDPLFVTIIRGDDQARFWSKVDKDGPLPERQPELGPCWIWTSSTTKGGYGKFNLAGRHRLAHRISYEWVVKAIPEGLQIDHLCRRPSCVRPSHLDPVPCRENLMRGNTLAAENAARIRCLRGHLFDEENTYINPSNGQRSCRICRRMTERNRKRAKREAALARAG